MPELPEIEATVRLLDAALAGATVDAARAPGLATMRTFAPPLDALEGATLTGLGRRGKLLLVGFAGGGLPGASPVGEAGTPDRPVPPDPDRPASPDDPANGGATVAGDPRVTSAVPVPPGSDAVLVLHLMSAGRLQLYDRRAGMRDRTTRLVVRVVGGGDAGDDGPERELRLREFGTKQAAWAKLLPVGELAGDETLTTLGPEAWPAPPELGATLPPRRTLRGALRDQRVIAGIGRSWADEILWTARLAPLRRGGDLDEGERARLRDAIVEVLDGTLRHYLGVRGAEVEDGPSAAADITAPGVDAPDPAAPDPGALGAGEPDGGVLALPLPDKLPLPLQVHRRAGRPCPRCGDPILAVHYEDDEMAYCATCQTDGKPYKDRRFSRLLKE
ncbi:MAG: DNA-formamidopyrimidine glycosylase family protein [Solirubrobacteraceae bacterium]